MSILKGAIETTERLCWSRWPASIYPASSCLSKPAQINFLSQRNRTWPFFALWLQVISTACSSTSPLVKPLMKKFVQSFLDPALQGRAIFFHRSSFLQEIGCKALKAAATFGRLEVLKVLLGLDVFRQYLGQREDDTAAPAVVMAAVEAGHVECFDLLVDDGVDILPTGTEVCWAPKH
eukprot:m.105236 g.105236  ORF g.105236 m.105236 type:complete len:178 (-) comp51638_c0_seq5:257-790(-)